MRLSKPSPRKRVNDSRSRTWYSICSSDKLYRDCKTNIRNSTSASIGLRPALLFLASSAVSTTASMSARNFSHGTSALIETNGSPFADSIDKRLSCTAWVNAIADASQQRLSRKAIHDRFNGDCLIGLDLEFQLHATP